MDLKKLGLFIAEEREKSGFKSQRQLALASQISNGSIARIESGKQKPSPGTIKLLSKHLNSTSYEELMEKAGYLTGREKTKVNLTNVSGEVIQEKSERLSGIDLYIKEIKEKYGDNAEVERMELVREMLKNIIDLPEEDQRRINDFAERLKK